MTRASFNWALIYGFSGTEPSSRLDGQKCIFFDAAQLGILRNYCVLSAGRLDLRAESRRLGEVTAKKYEYSPSLLHVKTGTKVQLKITPTAMVMVLTALSLCARGQCAHGRSFEAGSPKTLQGQAIM